MLALLAAAAIAAAAPQPGTERTPNLYRVPAGCRDTPYRVVDRFGRPVTTRLGDLPGAGAMLLVDRKVNGCPVITLMRGGTVGARDQPNPPASQYRVLPLRPAPDRAR